MADFGWSWPILHTTAAEAAAEADGQQRLKVTWCELDHRQWANLKGKLGRCHLIWLPSHLILTLTVPVCNLDDDAQLKVLLPSTSSHSSLLNTLCLSRRRH